MRSYRFGLVVNPIAGVGAALAWKGTDNIKAAWNAVISGAKQPVWSLLKRALNSISSTTKIEWFLGDDNPHFPKGKVLYKLPEKSTATHTKETIRKISIEDVDLIIFIGGDGTALDIISEESHIPILGIPAGVKIFSPCFLHRPEDLGITLTNWDGSTRIVDLLDLDEDAYHRSQTSAKLMGSALIPDVQQIQAGKISWGGDDESTFELIAERIMGEIGLESTIAVGPGSTMQNIFLHMGIKKSLLGVDIVENGVLKAKDCPSNELNEYDIEEIWISPIGMQGHIFGRGNRQITPKVIKSIGRKNIKIFSTHTKMQNTPFLYVDTGDPELDTELKGYYKVIVGYYEEKLRKVI